MTEESREENLGMERAPQITEVYEVSLFPDAGGPYKLQGAV